MRLIDADELKTAFPASENSTPVLIASVRATINHMPTIEQPKSYREGYQAGFKDGQISLSCSHEKDVQSEPEEPFDGCSDCIHSDDSLDICVLRRCKHADKPVECYEPKQPERMRGKWILQDDKDKKLFGWYFCSECGFVIGRHINFCSNCGADMREASK